MPFIEIKVDRGSAHSRDGTFTSNTQGISRSARNDRFLANVILRGRATKNLVHGKKNLSVRRPRCGTEFIDSRLSVNAKLVSSRSVAFSIFLPPNPQRGLRGEQFSPGPPTIKKGCEKPKYRPFIARSPAWRRLSCEVPDRREWGVKPKDLNLRASTYEIASPAACNDISLEEGDFSLRSK